MRRTFSVLVAAASALCRYGTLAAFGVLIAVVTLQVLGRVPGVPSPPWTEEVARFALVYLVAFSCGLALLRGELVNVDMFVAPLPPRVRWAVERVVDLVILVFALAILPGAYDYVDGSCRRKVRMSQFGKTEMSVPGRMNRGWEADDGLGCDERAGSSAG